MRELGQQRIGLQPCGQDAFGDDEQPRLGAEAALEAHLPADLAADRPAALVGDPRAIARAATRRGCSRMTRPSPTSAGGTRVVLPAPGAAVTTTARDRRTRSTIASRNGSIGRGTMGLTRESRVACRRTRRLNCDSTAFERQRASRRRRPDSSRRCRRGRSSRPGFFARYCWW